MTCTTMFTQDSGTRTIFDIDNNITHCHCSQKFLVYLKAKINKKIMQRSHLLKVALLVKMCRIEHEFSLGWLAFKLSGLSSYAYL